MATRHVARRPTGAPWARSGGFTLIEVFVAVVIVAILVAAALPSFTTLSARSQVTQVQNDLIADIAYARTEAVTRQALVQVTAASGGWGNGWTVVADSNTDGVVNGSDTTLRVHDKLSTGYSLLVKDKDGGALTSFTFGVVGSVTAPAATKTPVGITVCGTKATRDEAKVIQLSGAGSVNSHTGSATSLGC